MLIAASSDTSDASREELARRITEIALQIIEIYGTKEQLSNAPSFDFRHAGFHELDIAMMRSLLPVKTGRGDYQVLLDIKDRSPDASRKAPTVLAVGWNPLQPGAEPFKIFQFKRGSWIGLFLSMGILDLQPTRQIH